MDGNVGTGLIVPRSPLTRSRPQLTFKGGQGAAVCSRSLVAVPLPHDPAQDEGEAHRTGDPHGDDDDEG